MPVSLASFASFSSRAHLLFNGLLVNLYDHTIEAKAVNCSNSRLWESAEVHFPSTLLFRFFPGRAHLLFDLHVRSTGCLRSVPIAGSRRKPFLSCLKLRRERQKFTLRHSCLFAPFCMGHICCSTCTASLAVCVRSSFTVRV